MANLTILCPKCQTEVSVDEVLTKQLEDSLKSKSDTQLKAKLEEEKRKLHQLMAEWKEKEEEKLKKLLEKRSEDEAVELKHLKEENEKKTQQLRAAQELELKLRREKNAIEEREKNLELEVQRKMDESRKEIEVKVAQRMIDEHHLKEAEKEKIISDLRKALEEAQLKANQGSQQLQGEVLELELEEVLNSEFPYDEIKPVPKGMTGADVLQIVHDQTGRLCGVIIWESKRTKNWSEEWVGKLKDDQMVAKADVAILVSSALPDSIKSFGPKDGIYITSFESYIPVAKMIRLKVIELCLAKASSVGQDKKMEMLYNYLRGSEFRQRVEVIVETFNTLKDDLDKEKQLYTKIWAKREKQIQRVLDSTLGLHGDLEGLMGKELPEIASLEADNFEVLEVEEAEEVLQDDALSAASLFPVMDEPRH